MSNRPATVWLTIGVFAMAWLGAPPSPLLAQERGNSDPLALAASDSLASGLKMSPAQARGVFAQQNRSVANMRPLAVKYSIPLSNFELKNDGTLVMYVDRARVRPISAAEPRVEVRTLARTVDEVDQTFVMVRKKLGSPLPHGVFTIAKYYNEGRVELEISAGARSDPAVEAALSLPNVSSVIAPAGTDPEPTAFTATPGNYMGLGSLGHCSVGIRTARNYMISAGHCALNNGSLGVIATDGAGREIGRSNSSLYQNDGYDIGRFSINAGVTLARGYANYQGGTTAFTGSSIPITGAYICKSGTTTAMTCGQVKNPNTYVTYNGGTDLYEIFSSDVCSERGDSGGPVMNASSSQLLGVHSGASVVRDCGRNTYYTSQRYLTSYHSRIDYAFWYYRDSIALN